MALVYDDNLKMYRLMRLEDIAAAKPSEKHRALSHRPPAPSTSNISPASTLLIPLASRPNPPLLAHQNFRRLNQLAGASACRRYSLPEDDTVRDRHDPVSPLQTRHLDVSAASARSSDGEAFSRLAEHVCDAVESLQAHLAQSSLEQLAGVDASCEKEDARDANESRRSRRFILENIDRTIQSLEGLRKSLLARNPSPLGERIMTTSERVNPLRQRLHERTVVKQSAGPATDGSRTSAVEAQPLNEGHAASDAARPSFFRLRVADTSSWRQRFSSSTDRCRSFQVGSNTSASSSNNNTSQIEFDASTMQPPQRAPPKKPQ